jgi:hypothetical protein
LRSQPFVHANPQRLAAACTISIPDMALHFAKTPANAAIAAFAAANNRTQRNADRVAAHLA